MGVQVCTLNSSTLVYGLIGYSQGKLNLKTISTDLTIPSGTASDIFAGYTLGAGLETFVSDRMSLKLEYRFTQFREQDATKFQFDPADNSNSNFEPSLHTARITLSYHFGYDHLRAPISYK